MPVESLRLPGVELPSGTEAAADTTLELGFRSAALQVGFWLGWISIVVVLAGLALDVNVRHRWLMVGLALTGAAANTVAMRVPWHEWLPTRRGRALLDLWSGGLLTFVALLVAAGGTNFALLLFLAVPFIAVVQIGWRRGFWLAVSAGTCAIAAALIPLAAGATAMRLALVGAAVAVALFLARTIRRETAAHKQAATQAELERVLAQEANHRIKNNLQTVADLLLLGRPNDGADTAFDEAAARIRSIATVHRLLTESRNTVDASALLESIADGAPVPISVVAEPLEFDASTAQKLGIVANELITNAFQHGEPPIVVRLTGGRWTHLSIEDAGTGPLHTGGLGLDLVRRMAEQGLHGRFDLSALPEGGTRAAVAFPESP